MRIFTASLVTETNTFAPIPTGFRSFEEMGCFPRNASSAGETTLNQVARTFRSLAEAEGHEVFDSLYTFAQPAGRTLRSVYESYRDQILADLGGNGPIDMVLLLLHGAMAAEGYDDCDADILARVRAIVGARCVIGAELDAHCNLSEAMLTPADVLIAMKEYPHTDVYDRAGDLYRLCRDAREGKTKPTMELFDCRMIGFYPTTSEPMHGLVREMEALERREGILSVSLGHGFPWSDVADVGTKVLVVSDDDPALAASAAREFGMRFHAQRERLRTRFPGIDAALDRVRKTTGVVVLGDTADNPGGGAPGDNCSLLRAMLTNGCRDAVIGCFWDPMAVQFCAEAEVGSRFRLRLGGKTGPASGEPLDLSVIVRGLSDDLVQESFNGAHTFGRAAWVEAQGIDIVIVSVRQQTLSPSTFTKMGIELSGKTLIAVKSSHHFYDEFRELTNDIIHVATPGALRMDFAALPYTKRDLKYWPRVPSPFDEGLQP